MGRQVVCCYQITDQIPIAYTVYCGKKRAPTASEFGHSYVVVFDLLTQAGLLNKGYHLFVHNLNTSPTVADHLFSKDTLHHRNSLLQQEGCSSSLQGSIAKEERVCLL